MILARCQRAVEMYDRGESVHWQNLADLAPVFGWKWNGDREDKTYYKPSKSFTHSQDYREGIFNLARRMRIPSKIAKVAAETYFAKWPELQKWHEEVEQEAIQTRAVRNPFGFQRRFMDVTSKQKNRKRTLVLNWKQQKEATAFGPASSNAALWLIGLRDLHDAGMQIVSGSHDSFLLQCPEDDAEDVAKEAQRLLEREVPEFEEFIGRDDWKPRYDAAIGYNYRPWHEEDNPRGVREICECE